VHWNAEEVFSSRSRSAYPCFHPVSLADQPILVSTQTAMTRSRPIGLATYLLPTSIDRSVRRTIHQPIGSSSYPPASPHPSVPAAPKTTRMPPTTPASLVSVYQVDICPSDVHQTDICPLDVYQMSTSAQAPDGQDLPIHYPPSYPPIHLSLVLPRTRRP
jgi:hypothetical protein